jgi:hypothetical protein
MEQADPGEAIHPVGEGDFTFPTPGGRVRLSVTNDTLTPFGGLVPWAAFTKHIGIIDRLAADCPVKRTSPNAAPVYDVLQSFMLTALTDGRRFSHIERLRENTGTRPAITRLTEDQLHEAEAVYRRLAGQVRSLSFYVEFALTNYREPERLKALADAVADYVTAK